MRGHKFALQPLNSGEQVLKYGLPIAHATQPIAVGELIHSSNARTNLSDVDEYVYQPEHLTLPAQAADREVQIYRAPRARLAFVTSCDFTDRRLRERHRPTDCVTLSPGE